MIEVINLDKRFDKVQALSSLNLRVKKGSIYGLVGTNGSGKTTALKHITGILRADAGTVRIEDVDVYENLKIKECIGFIPDDLYFFNMYNLRDSARFHSRIYPHWNWDVYRRTLADFELDEKRRLSKFSKGMQKQAAFVLTLSAGPDYLILDEPIDGLDPLVRKLVWRHIVGGVADRGMTVLVSSHNLREMEGVCDAIGILSKGSMLIERDLDELKSDIHKVQVAFAADAPRENLYEGLNVLHAESRGAVDLLIVRNPKDAVEAVIRRQSPLIFDLLPLTLEEIFIYEIGGGKSAIDNILL
ncbi:MAG: ABC transporter ATP-binding protein [Clostridiales Family XIII bacterium]|jgi:ABC-2 type transport system ATP-binding protein|nr:ABC transporter ATP-binding protein [Clostridiales Family XIII bacterium]